MSNIMGRESINKQCYEEAAHRREVGVPKMETITGNNTKIREALEKFVRAYGHEKCVHTTLLAEAYEDAKAILTVPPEPIGNVVKTHKTDDWLNQLVSLINGKINHYMSQGVDYFSVDCGPWNITYDNTKGESDESK